MEIISFITDIFKNDNFLIIEIAFMIKAKVQVLLDDTLGKQIIH